MVKHLRDNKGQYAGSIGDGKHKIPQPTPKLSPPSPTGDYLKTMIALIDHRATSENPIDRRFAASEQPLNRTIAEHLTNDTDAAVALILVDNPTLDDDLLLKLSHHTNFNIRQATIETNRLPNKRHHELAEDPNETIRATIATYTPDINLLKKLSHKNSREILSGIAINNHVTPALLTQLATSQYIDVRERVAGNPKTPIKILKTYAQEENRRILDALAENSHTPAHITEHIFYKLDEETQYRAIVDNRVTQTFLQNVAETHPSKNIRKDAKYWLNYLKSKENP